MKKFQMFLTVFVGAVFASLAAAPLAMAAEGGEASGQGGLIALGAGLAHYAHDKLKLKKVAVIDDRTAYGKGVADVFAKVAKELGIALSEGEGPHPLSRLDHALYLGRELQKAQWCLEQGIAYVQD